MEVYAPTCFTRWKTPRTSTRSPSLMASVPNVKTFTVSPWSESLNVVYGFPRRDVRLLTSPAVPLTVTVFWSKAVGFFAISATVAALAHRVEPASASTQISASVRAARREPIMVPMDTIFPIGQRPAGQSSWLDRHDVQLGPFLLVVRTWDRLQDSLRDSPVARRTRRPRTPPRCGT